MENNGTKEKVIVKSAKPKVWKDKTFYEMELEDGRVGSSSDAKIMEYVGKEVEVEIKPGKEYKGVPHYYFNLPGQANGNGKKSFAPKDYTADKRMNALTNAVNSVKQIEGKITTGAVIALADKYFEWLNTK